MRRLAPFDRALVLTLVPLWAVCAALSLETQIDGGGVAMVGLALEDARSHPALTGEYSFVHPEDPLAAAGLRAKDRLLRVGESDLRGVGTLGFAWYARDAAGPALEAPLVFERQRERREASLPLAPVSIFRGRLAISFSLALTALFLLLRARPTPLVRACFHAGIAAAFPMTYFAGGPLELHAWGVAFVAGCALAPPLIFRFLLLFPDGVAPRERWHRIWPWGLALPGLFAGLLLAGRIAAGEAGLLASGALIAAAVLALSTWKYRRGDAVTRRQLRWVLFGAYCAALPLLVASAVNAVGPRLGWLYFASFWAGALLPLSMLVSVARFNLFDIDRILSATASYNVLLVLLVGGGLVFVPRLGQAASTLVGVDQQTGQLALSLVLATLLVPAHRHLRPQVDRLFFKERYALDHGIRELLPTLSDCTDARELIERVGTEIHRLFRPEACVVYAAVEQSYAPVFVEGRAVPAAFEAEGPLVGTLRGRRTPLSLGDAGRRPDEARLGPFDRAALETLQVEVIVPVRRDGTLSAFLCLGTKRSGDVYTSTDLSLLLAVTETMSRELRRFDQEETLHEARAMQASLRRYVPGAIAEQLWSGNEPASGEREVTVLFVDIRGYTGFAEGRRAEEIFSTVNRYTETVSQIVERHAGSVVEFNGDGMMAVFGAPRDLAHKERAAVEAGCEIVEAVAALPVENGASQPTKLSVGVGIATGEAFVGSIRAVDRMIWSAIGNTTNLAARLQGLTRELDASLVVDRRTWERAQPAAEHFEQRAGARIRGRRDTQDVYALPMCSSA